MQMRILIIRNDRLGDFMLAWPALALLRHYLPDAEIDVLVPHYTAQIAEVCPYINNVILMPEKSSGIKCATKLANTFRSLHYDAMISLYSKGSVAFAGLMAKIPYRLAPATKWVQLLATDRLTQRRSRSLKPEYAYNCDLVRHYLTTHNIPQPLNSDSTSDSEYLPSELQRPLLKLGSKEVTTLHKQFITSHKVEPETLLIFIHPGSGGSATTLQINQYAEIARGLCSKHKIYYVVTAGPGEEDNGMQLIQLLNQQNNRATLLQPSGGLVELACYLSFANLLICGSTGPLHIAGALNRPTAAFYPKNRSASPLRWETMNHPERRLAFIPPDGKDPKDVSKTKIQPSVKAINKLLTTLYD
jgi:ADP-heptose:LPS heptosyltransferase